MPTKMDLPRCYISIANLCDKCYNTFCQDDSIDNCDGICLRMCYFWTANLLKNVLNVTIFRMFSDKLTAKSEQIPKALAIFLSCMIIRAVR